MKIAIYGHMRIWHHFKSIGVCLALVMSPAFLMAAVCEGFYKLPSKPISERFIDFFQTRSKDSILIVVDQFLLQETTPLLNRLETELELFQRVGTDSPMRSETQTAEINLTRVFSLVGKMEKLVRSSSWYQSEAKKKMKIDDLATEIMECKAQADQCYGPLNTAIEQSGQSVRKLGDLKDAFDNKITEMEEYDSYMTEHYRRFGFGADQSLQFIKLKAQQLKNQSKIIEDMMENEKVFIILALQKIRNDYPALNQRLRDLVASGAPRKINEKIPETSKDSKDQMIEMERRKKVQSILELLKLNDSKEASLGFFKFTQRNKVKLSLVHDQLTKADLTFTVEEGIEILKAVPANVTNWGERYEGKGDSYSSPLLSDLFHLGGYKGSDGFNSYWIEANAEIAWMILIKTVPTANDSLSNKKKLKRLIQTHLASEYKSNQKYIESLTLAFMKRWEPFR